MASVSYQIANLLEKMTSTDKDFRFMATNDLMNELQKDSIKLDDESEGKVVRMILHLLEDKNGEVQNLAVKCLGPLVNKVREMHVERIVDVLCGNMLADHEQLRDISSIGLKTVISELSPTNHNIIANVCRRITGRLTNAIEQQNDVSVQLEALDILSDLLSRFGTLILSFQQQILVSLLPQLRSPRQAVRKRTIVALGNFVLSCNSATYARIIDHLLESLSTIEDPTAAAQSTQRTYIQCIASICRHAGHRFGEHIERIVPVIVGYSARDDDELREYCLQAFEAFVHRCPKEITPHINDITELCLRYMTYDPNYNYDDEDVEGVQSGDDAGAMETEDDGDIDEDDEYSDDDDMSWKVRRSAAKCLEAIILTRHELLAHFYRCVSPALIARFKEREENVKSDVFRAYVALLRQTRTAGGAMATDPNQMDESETPVSMLQSQVPMIVHAVQKPMREKSVKTRQDCFTLLKELVGVLPGALTNHLDAILPGVRYSLSDKNASGGTKIDTLQFVHCLVVTHHREVFRPHLSTLLPLIIAAVNDSFYKITAEALLLLQEFVGIIKPGGIVDVDEASRFVNILYECTLVRLRAADIDQEVKERAISCMGRILAEFGNSLHVSDLPACLSIFVDRLRNEITRLTTVKALIRVAASDDGVDLTPIIVQTVPLLSKFLRKNQRALKLSTLTLLDTLARKFANKKSITLDIVQNQNVTSEMLFLGVIDELPPLIEDTDLHIAQLTLILLNSIAVYYSLTLIRISDRVLPEIIILVKSPLLQGAALDALLCFFQSLVAAKLPGLGYHDLLRMLSSLVRPAEPGSGQLLLHKQAYYSLAKCVAAIAVTDSKLAHNVVEKFLEDIKPMRGDPQHIFGLLVVGEIGRHIDLGNLPNLQDVLLDSFKPPSEEVKSAASYALGSVAVGNLRLYVPFILTQIDSHPGKQYLLLHSLKEVISCMSTTSEGICQILEHAPDIWSKLFIHCESAEEGTRNVVSECLGKLALIDPAQFLPRLQEGLQTPCPLMRTTVITAVKFCISDQPQAIDSALRQSMAQFLTTLTDPDLNVRRVTLVAFNSAAHNKPSLIRDLLDIVLPRLYEETKIKRELIREVEMGPFKHTVDDGLDVRKAAFECMYTLLDTCLDRLDVFEFLDQVESGLRDHYDIKMLTYLMVARLAHLCPNAVLQKLEGLVEPLRKTCTLKVKANSVKQEYEKQDELKRSAMRAVAALMTIPDAEKNPALSEFIAHIKATSDLQPIFESIRRDRDINQPGTSRQYDANIMDQS